jgi:nucleotide-binding universal stress UspA family protein
MKGGVIAMDIKNVLVPVDFSPPSRLAVNYGVELARKFRARLTLLHVVESGAAVVAGFPGEGSDAAKKHGEQALRMLSALIAPEDQDDLDLRIVMKSGDIKDEIASVIDEQHADIAVMGTHGRGLFSRWLIGSVTEGILRKVSIPILTVCHATRPLAFNRILFATDCTESSKRAFDFVLEMACSMGSQVTLLHALDPVAVTYGGAEMAQYIDRHNATEVQSELAGLVAEGAQQDVRVETVIAEGFAADEIAKAAEEYNADLLFIAVKHKGLVERVLLGTTAERAIREAHIPVLSIPVG